MPKGTFNNPNSLFVRKVHEFEADLITKTILDCRDVKVAAEFLGLEPGTLSDKCKRYGINHRELKRESIRRRKEEEKARKAAEKVEKAKQAEREKEEKLRRFQAGEPVS